MFAKTFRNTLIASTLVVAGSVLANPAMAQNVTDGTVTVGGGVSETLGLEISEVANIATTLPLDGEVGGQAVGGAVQIVKVADLTMYTNNSTGYTLTVGQGNLTNEDEINIAYRVAVTASTTPAVIGSFADGASYEFSTAGANARVEDAHQLSISYTPLALQDPGNYSATITLDIADNQ